METNYVKGERAVTLESLIKEVMVLIHDDMLKADDVLGDVAYDTEGSLRSKTLKLCNAFAEIDSHGGTCEEDSKFFEDAVETAKRFLVQGFLKDFLCVLLEAQRRGCAEVRAHDAEPLCLKQILKPVEKGGAK